MSALGKHFAYTLHNLVGHPLSELLHLVGLRRASEWVHSATLPAEAHPDSPPQPEPGK